MARHNQVDIYCPFYRYRVGIDTGIVDLIREFWRVGIKTKFSCQDGYFDGYPYNKMDGGNMWISFNYIDFVKFFSIARNVKGIKRHIFLKSSPKHWWKYEMFPNNDDIISFDCHVIFPGIDYDKLVKHFKKINPPVAQLDIERVATNHKAASSSLARGSK